MSRKGSAIVALVVADQPLGRPAELALSRLVRALQAHGVSVRQARDLTGEEDDTILVVGVSERSPTLSRLANEASRSLPTSPESLAFCRLDSHRPPTLLIAGADDRGLAYALLEGARRVELAETVTDLMGLFPDETESPELAVRSVCIFPHNEELEREWFYSREFWDDYFSNLALQRFNAFSLTFGHQTAYLAPPYPFFVDVTEHPEVSVPGLSPDDRERNLETLRMISGLAVEHGLDFTLGVWQQHAHEYGRSTVDGLGSENLESFCAAGMRRLLAACPEISGVQLRVNAESGILLEEEPSFWRAIFASVSNRGRRIRLDIRAKAITDDTIQAALETGLPVTVSAKYWTEHQGLPYHATQLQYADRLVRRHSYGDLLSSPREYSFLFRLWNLGSNKLLLWGGADWARRFAQSCRLGGAEGFEVCSPLSNRGFRNVGGHWPLFVDRGFEFCRWDIQRYWYWHLLFGRLGYSSSTAERVWLREFEARFGVEAAPHVARAYETASRFLPLITASHSPSASVFGYWPEKDTGGLLDFYIEVEPSDVARFYGVGEYVRAYLDDRLQAKLTPRQLSARFEAMAIAAEEEIATAEMSVVEAGLREFKGTKLDVLVQTTLARYHSRKLQAAEELAFFYAAGDYTSLKTAHKDAVAALSSWEHLVKLTDGVYHGNLIFGPEPEQVGHWKDNLVYARQDVSRIQEVEDIFLRYGLFDLAFDFGAPPARRTGPWAQVMLGDYSVERRFVGISTDSLYSSGVGYGWHSIRDIVASAAPRVEASTLKGAGKPDAMAGPRQVSDPMTGGDGEIMPVMPEGMLYADHIRRGSKAHYDNNAFLVELPNGLYELTFVMVDRSEQSHEHGPMWITVQGKHRTEEFVVPVGKLVEKRLRAPVRDGRLEVELNAHPATDWIITALVVTRVAPHLGHVPVRRAVPDSELRIVATVTGPERTSRVTLLSRVGDTGPYQEVQMVEDQDQGLVYAASLDVSRDATLVQYYLEAEDALGNLACYPSEGATSPISVALGDAHASPIVEHTPIGSCAAGKPLEVRVRIHADAPIRSARLYYRDLNQKQAFVPVDMNCERGEYVATIPGEDITARWGLMYYVEAIDVLGNAAAYPDLDLQQPYWLVAVQC